MRAMDEMKQKHREVWPCTPLFLHTVMREYMLDVSVRACKCAERVPLQLNLTVPLLLVQEFTRMAVLSDALQFEPDVQH